MLPLYSSPILFKYPSSVTGLQRSSRHMKALGRRSSIQKIISARLSRMSRLIGVKLQSNIHAPEGGLKSVFRRITRTNEITGLVFESLTVKPSVTWLEQSWRK